MSAAGRTATPRPPARIALLGGECTGKSTLARALGARLGAQVVDERLRRFCDEMRRAPLASEQRWLIKVLHKSNQLYPNDEYIL